jgi:hypothetical protein
MLETLKEIWEKDRRAACLVLGGLGACLPVIAFVAIGFWPFVRFITLAESLDAFQDQFGDCVQVSWSIPPTGSADAYVSVTNKSGHEWKSVSIILNPPDSGFDALRFWGERVCVSESGFRAPADKIKMLGSVAPGATLIVPLAQCVHTGTGEKFNLEHFTLKRLFVRALVPYRGNELQCTCISPPTD